MNHDMPIGFTITKRLPLLVILTTLIFGMVQEGYGQTRSYLTGQKTGNKTLAPGITLSTGTAGLTTPMSEHTYLLVTEFYYGPASILNSSPVEYTTVRAAQDLGVLGLLGAGGNAYIQFRNTNNNNLGAGQTTFFAHGPNQPTIRGVSLDVGALLGLSQETNIFGEGYSGAGNYSTSWSGNENPGVLAGSAISRMLIDQDGNYYTAVTPNSQHNSVRLNVNLPGGLRVADIARSLEVRVYNAFTETPGDDCSIFGRYTTPPEVNGIALNTGILNLNTDSLIANPHFALTNNETQYASYSAGLLGLGVANTISQTIFFDHKANAGDSFYAKISLENSLIGVDLLGLNGITFTAYNDETPVWSSDLSSIANLLGLDLLNLINLGGNHSALEITANPNTPFNRVQISFSPGLLDLNVLGDAFRVYTLKLAPASPTITGQPTNQEICAGENVTFTASATTPSGAITGYQWQYHNGSSWVNAPGESDTESYMITNVPQTHTGRIYRVAITGGQPGCEQTVYSSGAELSVTPIPGRAHVNFTEANN